MKFTDLLGPEAAAAFASMLGTLPAYVHVGERAAWELAESLGRECVGRHVVVLFDTRTRAAAGETCLRALHDAGWHATERLVADRPGGQSPICDDTTKDGLQRELPTVDAMVAVGSGVVNDLTKWLAAEAGVPYAVYATATSMNGYSAANVAPTIQGVKTLFRARAPRVIAADPRVLESAPHESTSAGLGDLIAKPVSTADWRINHMLFGESYSHEIAALIDRVEPMYLSDPASVARHEPSAIRALFEALVLSGSAMTLQGSSLPASGGEHLISHTLDMAGELDGVGHDLHGRQVGVATIFAAALYEKLLERDDWKFEVPAVEFEPEVWGASAPVVEIEFRKKRSAMARACGRLAEPGVWTAIRDAIEPTMRSPHRIKQCLAEANAAHRVQDIGCSRDRFLGAVRSCAWMRGRFTSIDLALCAGVLPDAAEEIVDRFLM